MAGSERKVFREHRVADSFDNPGSPAPDENSPRDFQPLTDRGANFHSEKFCFLPDKIMVKPTNVIKTISKIFLCIGLFIVVISLISGLFLPGIVFGLFFSGFSWLIRSVCAGGHAEFDLKNKYFYPCGQKPGKKYIAPIPLEHADFLYLLEKICRGSKGSSYPCYELNLSMKNGDRYNLLCHGSRIGMQKDAEQLASLLNLPLEHGTDPEKERSGKRKKNDSGFLIFIIGIFFLFIGGIAAYQMCIAPIYGFIKCQSWEQAPAVIQRSYIQSYRGSKGQRHYRLEFSYGYLYKGKQYKSNRYDYFVHHIDNHRVLRKITRNYPVGKGTICHVNPKAPSQAVLSKKFLPEVLLPMGFSTLFPAAGIILLIIGFRKKKKAE